MVELVVWLAALDYAGPIRHRPCETKIERVQVFGQRADGTPLLKDGKPVKVGIDEADDVPAVKDLREMVKRSRELRREADRLIREVDELERVIRSKPDPRR